MAHLLKGPSGHLLKKPSGHLAITPNWPLAYDVTWGGAAGAFDNLFTDGYCFAEIISQSSTIINYAGLLADVGASSYRFVLALSISTSLFGLNNVFFQRNLNNGSGWTTYVSRARDKNLSVIANWGSTGTDAYGKRLTDVTIALPP